MVFFGVLGQMVDSPTGMMSLSSEVSTVPLFLIVLSIVTIIATVIGIHLWAKKHLPVVRDVPAPLPPGVARESIVPRAEIERVNKEIEELNKRLGRVD